jgi:hypothetical protein
MSTPKTFQSSRMTSSNSLESQIRTRPNVTYRINSGIFYVRDAFVCTDLKVEISFPGSTKLCVCDEEGEPRDVRTEDLDRCYVSSVLRGVMTDPFEDDFDKFQHFMSSLCRITRDYDIDVKKPISFEEINMNFKMPLRVLAKYVQLRKIYSWIKKYFLDH